MLFFICIFTSLNIKLMLTFLCYSAVGEWITCISLRTRAHWNMVYNIATSVLSTSTDAWISTFILQTSFVAITLSIEHALWSACFEWITNIFLNTFTMCSPVSFCANSIWTTWWWIAWFINNRSWGCCRNKYNIFSLQLHCNIFEYFCWTYMVDWKCIVWMDLQCILPRRYKQVYG